MAKKPVQLKPRVIRKRKRQDLPDSPEKVIKVEDTKEEVMELPPKQPTATVTAAHIDLIESYIAKASYGEMLMKTNLDKVRREVAALKRKLNEISQCRSQNIFCSINFY